MTKKEMKLIPFSIKDCEPENVKIPYGVQLCNAPDIWTKYKEEGSGIVIAVLDTGIDVDHLDLIGCNVGGKNFTAEGIGDQDIQDHNGHGTHVSGSIAANGKIVGIAPKASILTCKVLDRNGSGSYSAIIDGLNYATAWRGENGERVRIINLSLGGPVDDPILEQAILSACAAGIVVIAAAGNEGDNNLDSFEYGFPACYNETITIAACDKHKKLAFFSNNNLQIDAIGAGVDVLSTYPKNSYATLSGTSMAAPHIAGIMALLIKLGEKEFRRELTESEIYGLLTRVCCGLGYPASAEGHGLPNLNEFFSNC